VELLPFNPRSDYPLGVRRPDLVRTPSGKPLDEITIERVASGDVNPQEIRISSDTLRLQARIADAHGRTPLAANLRRAAELVKLPDERIFTIYRLLRPYRATAEELLAVARELEHTHGCPLNAAFLREAAEVYEKRGILRKP
jgi:propanediol dehydratase small subunit